MRLKLSYSFGSITIHDFFLVGEMKEGVVVSYELNQVLIDIALKYFPNKPVVYISRRKKSYSVNPKVYLKSMQIKNLVGIAIVLENNTVIDNTAVEKLFFSKPFEIFSNFEEAKFWATNLYNEKLALF